MKTRREETYGKALGGMLAAINPVKKVVAKTHCTVHKFINIQAIEILKNEGYDEESEFFKKNISKFNAGVQFADQDFKSINHFYHYKNGDGLYGFSNALTEFNNYYALSQNALKMKNIETSMFYLGAAVHLVHDTTVPQHVNNKLLSSHRNFELWVIRNFMQDFAYKSNEGIIFEKNIQNYIKHNAIYANDVYRANNLIIDRDEKYSKVSIKTIVRAEQSTAGLLLDFYKNEVLKSK